MKSTIFALLLTFTIQSQAAGRLEFMTCAKDLERIMFADPKAYPFIRLMNQAGTSRTYLEFVEAPAGHSGQHFSVTAEIATLQPNHIVLQSVTGAHPRIVGGFVPSKTSRCPRPGQNDSCWDGKFKVEGFETIFNLECVASFN